VLVRGETETSCGDAPPRARPALGFTGVHDEPRRPEGTVLHDLVREHLGAFLDPVRDAYERPLPRYMEKAFHEYLRCGVFAHGFLRFYCDDCGGDLLAAFSCKGRGVCPSCGQRRMCNTAGHLVDRVLPSVPVRQWVLSPPFELRRAAAFPADVATALGRIFIEEVAANQKRRAGISGAEHGAVNFLQRFGGSLNLNLHFHAMVLDGVFTRDEDGTARFDDTGAPTQEALQRIVRRVRDRSVRWLRKDGLMDARPVQEHSNEPPDGGAIDACANVALGGGTLVRLDAEGASRTEDGDHRHFATSMITVLDLEADVDRIWYGGREVRLGAFPMGVDAATFSSLADAPDVIQDVVRMRAASKEEHILLGIDRLDYTKGIPRRLLAVERLLERDPSLRGKVKLLQVAVPSRDKVTAYQDFRRDVEHLAGRINGAHATVDSAPIHYIYRSFSAR